jgi:hypothetical protein
LYYYVSVSPRPATILPTFVVSELARLHWEFVLPLSFVPLSFVIFGGPSRNSPFGCGSAALCLGAFV